MTDIPNKPKYDRDVKPPKRPRAKRTGIALDEDHRAKVREFMTLAEIERDSMGLPFPEGCDQLRYMNAVTGFCNGIGGAGWSRVRNMKDGSWRLWKRGQPDPARRGVG
ncbi:hypothetical protein BAJUN_00150 [Bajunvirus bajun]|uniref:Uncharacterized protein n=1 Tax=Brevundimonas phage vB_BgoS-Bajun TaxID=2948594 RepID=A0A9E7SU00_9CAUD|nr:hypothetical protein BAJUN_00150 [Brevundimonas phage vB_BgoS-Bajun]